MTDTAEPTGRITMRYDFPNRVSGVKAAEAEMTRLGRSLLRVTLRGDAKAADYLEARLRRCGRVVQRLRHLETVTE